MRAEVRNQIVEHLREKLPFGIQVHSGRRLPLRITEFPFASVYTDQEQSELFNEAPPLFKKTLDLVIEIVCHSEAMDFKIEDICNCVEDLMMKSDTLENHTFRVIPKSTTIESAIQGEIPMIVARLTFEVTYFEGLQSDDAISLESTTLEMEVYESKN